MKRTLFVLLTITLCLSFLSGCSDPGTRDETQQQETSNRTTADLDTYGTAYYEETQSVNTDTGDSGTVSDKYSYSNVYVSSGGQEIRPIQCFLGSTYYENDEAVLSGCGDGVYSVFNDPDTDQEDFPVLVYGGEITASVPMNVILGSIKVYDTNYNELKLRYDSFAGLSELTQGEYLIVFSEQTDGRGCNAEIRDYYITDNESFFKLVISG